MRMPPDQNGHGGSQRAWHLLQALVPLGEVHFVLLYRNHDHDCMTTSLEPLVPLVKSITRIEIAQWRVSNDRLFGIFHPGIGDFFDIRSREAPRLSKRSLAAIAAHLPIRRADLIFAGRLCTATIVQALIDAGALTASQRVVDFDDLMSNFVALQRHNSGATLGRQGRVLARLDARVIAKAEREIAGQWQGVSLCSDEDVAGLAAQCPSAHIVKIPNIVLREELPARQLDGKFRLLFLGNLSFSPNTAGLLAFLQEVWPGLKLAVPETELVVVGINPPDALRETLALFEIPLHADVPAVAPYYNACDVMIAPILFGSGTRSKILEAMAYGRAVVSTEVGAAGLGLRDGEEVLLARDMKGFGEALVRLARDGALRQAMATRARAFQRRHYGPNVIADGVRRLVSAPQPPFDVTEEAYPAQHDIR